MTAAKDKHTDRHEGRSETKYRHALPLGPDVTRQCNQPSDQPFWTYGRPRTTDQKLTETVLFRSGPGEPVGEVCVDEVRVSHRPTHLLSDPHLCMREIRLGTAQVLSQITDIAKERKNLTTQSTDSTIK